jgi:hypothetical protein
MPCSASLHQTWRGVLPSAKEAVICQQLSRPKKKEKRSSSRMTTEKDRHLFGLRRSHIGFVRFGCPESESVHATRNGFRHAQLQSALSKSGKRAAFDSAAFSGRLSCFIHLGDGERCGTPHRYGTRKRMPIRSHHETGDWSAFGTFGATDRTQAMANRRSARNHSTVD